MTDFRPMLAPDRGQAATTIRLVPKAALADFKAGLTDAGRAAVTTAAFQAEPDQLAFVPTSSGWMLAVGLGDVERAGRWTLAAAAARLPSGLYRVEGELSAVALHGWLLAQHRFARFRASPQPEGARTLLVKDAGLIEQALAEARAISILRDMIDTPAEQLGPDELEQAVRTLASETGATCSATVGEALLEGNFPAIHAVGRASPRRPRIVTLDWGEERHPLVALVGKGVCFDTGGLNLKPGNSMSLMKKDMGGAAHALALARLVIARRLPLRLKLVIAAVDNAVSGNAIRPGDVIATRKGLSVEVGNTDAEGRLVLADALALACEAGPSLVLDFATLTGAARVALGPELPALFANNDDLAQGLLQSAEAVEDPLWRLPLWQPYRKMFRSDIADMNNNAEGGFAGAIVGGLFLERFVEAETPWAHLDLYAWNQTALPGRPKGGAAMGIFACLDYLARHYQ